MEVPVSDDDFHDAYHEMRQAAEDLARWIMGLCAVILAVCALFLFEMSGAAVAVADWLAGVIL